MLSLLTPPPLTRLGSYARYGSALFRQYSVGTILRAVLVGAHAPSYNTVQVVVKRELCPSCKADLPTVAECQAWMRGQSVSTARACLHVCLAGWVALGSFGFWTLAW